MTLIQAVVADLITHVCSGDIGQYRDVTTVGQMVGEYEKHLKNIIF
jgi:hypothetical protein